MPCRSDPPDPTKYDIEMAKVLALLNELAGMPLPENYGQTYWKGTTLQMLDESTENLCSKLKEINDVSRYSLEMQIWWRDHQKADAKRKVENEKKAKELDSYMDAHIGITINNHICICAYSKVACGKCRQAFSFKINRDQYAILKEMMREGPQVLYVVTSRDHQNFLFVSTDKPRANQAKKDQTEKEEAMGGKPSVFIQETTVQ